MIIFRHEMRQLRRNIIIWSLVLASCIFLMLPVYIDMLTSSAASMKSLSGNTYFEALGTNLEIITTPLGTYSFLTTFVLIACAMNGVYMGLVLVTKEYAQKAADFLMTKPQSRFAVFFSKLGAAMLASVVIGIVYLLASWAGMARAGTGAYAFIPFLLIALSVIFVQFLFVATGLLIGIIFPMIRTPISVSAGVAFLMYITGSFSIKAQVPFAGYFSPYLYFNGADIIVTGGYDAVNLILYVLILAALVAVAYWIFRKKDIVLVS